MQVKINKSVVVIGGGLSGLATAALLAKKGWNVTLLEKNVSLGGRARVLRKNGFQFDMGPSWYLMPEVFEHYFSLFGKKSSDYYDLIRLDPRYQVFFGNKEQVSISENIEKTVAWFEEQEPGAGDQLKKFLLKSKRSYEVAVRLMYLDIWNFKNWFNKENILGLLTIQKTLSFWKNWDLELQKYFKKTSLRQVLSFTSVFLGGSPFNTPALYSILTWAEFEKGVWYPKGGMGKVVDTLSSLATQYGVKIITNQEAKNILIEDGKAIGVSTGKTFYPADVVIGATDLPLIETKMLPKKYQSWSQSYWNKKTLGISALLLYIGLNKRIDNIHHHTLYFSPDWKKNFTSIFIDKKLPDDASFYISARSVTDRTIVPKGAEEVFVLIPLGAGGKYRKKDLDALSKKVILKIESLWKVKISNNIVVKEVFTPFDFAKSYNAFEGTALGLAHTFFQSLWFRPGNKSKKVKNLYYVGQYTNPGVGVPMTLVSAEMVSTMIGYPPNDNKEIFKKGSVTYYYSSLFFNGQVKEDVFAMYAYVRVADDYVDAKKPFISEFENMWEDTKRAWQGQRVKDDVVNRFIELAKRKQFEWEWIEAFWEAMLSDLHKKYYRNSKELDQYMFGSAEVIGLMMAKILDLPRAAASAAALQGKAMQLINFIRDVEEDEQLGRNYLGYDVKTKNDSEKWKSFIQAQIEKYWKLQKKAEKGYEYIPKKYLIPIKTAAQMYGWTAKQIYNNPSIVWNKKVKPSKLKVVSTLLRNILFA